MNELFIILPVVAIISIAVIIYATRNAQEIKEEQPSTFQPRKVTFVVSETEKPKRKKKKYYNKKKKPAVANNETTEKRPVGRPRKTVD
jgi:hypothetical protein